MAEQTGTPIFADKLYARRPLYAELAPIAADLGRQALHAGVLGFTHPTTFARHRFEVPLPADIQRALDALRKL
jgi:23S rRNA pseudouridine1911/1915/1917 synthase